MVKIYFRVGASKCNLTLVDLHTLLHFVTRHYNNELVLETTVICGSKWVQTIFIQNIN